MQQTPAGYSFCDALRGAEVGQEYAWEVDERVTHPICVDCAIQMRPDPDERDLELMIGCMLESAIGIHTSAHVVAGLGGFNYIDLDGNRLLAEDVIQDDGPIHDIAGPGHGVTPT